jgi:hypothetical protein
MQFQGFPLYKGEGQLTRIKRTTRNIKSKIPAYVAGIFLSTAWDASSENSIPIKA